MKNQEEKLLETKFVT